MDIKRLYANVPSGHDSNNAHLVLLIEFMDRGEGYVLRDGSEIKRSGVGVNTSRSLQTLLHQAWLHYGVAYDDWCAMVDDNRTVVPNIPELIADRAPMMLTYIYQSDVQETDRLVLKESVHQSGIVMEIHRRNGEVFDNWCENLKKALFIADNQYGIEQSEWIRHFPDGSTKLVSFDYDFSDLQPNTEDR